MESNPEAIKVKCSKEPLIKRIAELEKENEELRGLLLIIFPFLVIFAGIGIITIIRFILILIEVII